jgi:hypothetical protein
MIKASIPCLGSDCGLKPCLLDHGPGECPSVFRKTGVALSVEAIGKSRVTFGSSSDIEYKILIIKHMLNR